MPPTGSRAERGITMRVRLDLPTDAHNLQIRVETAQSKYREWGDKQTVAGHMWTFSPIRSARDTCSPRTLTAGHPAAIRLRPGARPHSISRHQRTAEQAC